MILSTLNKLNYIYVSQLKKFIYLSLSVFKK